MATSAHKRLTPDRAGQHQLEHSHLPTHPRGPEPALGGGPTQRHHPVGAVRQPVAQPLGLADWKRHSGGWTLVPPGNRLATSSEDGQALWAAGPDAPAQWSPITVLEAHDGPARRLRPQGRISGLSGA